MKILLVEDDPELARQVMALLAREGHACEWRERGGDGLEAAEETGFDAIILDAGLPDMDGFAVVAELRSRGRQTPVLFLTARDTVTDRVKGLRSGADDYLTKPFAVEELLARLEALHRRAGQVAPAARQKLGRWELDSTMRRLLAGDEVVFLQPREWTLLDVLMNHEGRVLTKKFLLEKVWDFHFDPGSNVVDVTICKLRSKIDEPGRPSFIRNVRGKGYVFEDLPG
jgi:DNA-binding response OmpR family regulator